MFDSTPEGVKTRIRGLLDKSSGKTQAALARHCGVSTAAVAQWMKTGGISLENLMKASDFFGVSFEWLRTGEGSKERSNGVKAFFPDEEPIPSGYVSIPEYELAFRAGGCPDAPEPEWEEVHESKPAIYRADFFTIRGLSPNRCRRAKVTGDSMEPYICKGDTILFEEFSDRHPASIHIHDGDVYVLTIDGDYRVKRLSKVKNGIRISSDNSSKYEDEIYTGQEVDDRIRIYGRVIEVSRTL